MSAIRQAGGCGGGGRGGSSYLKPIYGRNFPATFDSLRNGPESEYCWQLKKFVFSEDFAIRFAMNVYLALLTLVWLQSNYLRKGH